MQVDHHDCDIAGNVSGGVLLKMADEVAALAASKHTMGGTPTTACMDAVDFNKMVPKGDQSHEHVHVVTAFLAIVFLNCELFLRLNVRFIHS